MIKKFIIKFLYFILYSLLLLLGGSKNGAFKISHNRWMNLELPFGSLDGSIQESLFCGFFFSSFQFLMGWAESDWAWCFWAGRI